MNATYRYALPVLAALLLAACGGGGSSETVSGSSQLQTATVGVLLTDAPGDEWDEAWATVRRVELLGDNREVLFEGEETVDLLRLRDAYELFAIREDVRAGSYNKIRLILDRLELVQRDANGAELRRETADLPGNGKLDLNPRGSFVIAPGTVVALSIDFDMDKSFKIMETGNGRLKVRPVIFVDVMTRLPDLTRFARIFGRIDEIYSVNSAFRLCQEGLVAQPLDDHRPILPEYFRCLTVRTDEATGLFGEDGLPVEFDDMEVGDPVTVAGRLRLVGDNENDIADDDDRQVRRVALAAVVVESGVPGTFRRWSGVAQDVVDPATVRFDFELAQGQGVNPPEIAVQLYPKTRIFTRAGIEVGRNAISADERARIDAVLNIGETDELRAALVVLEAGAALPDVLLKATVISVDSASGTLRVETVDGDRWIDVDPAARIFEVTAVNDGLDTQRIELADLQPGQEVSLFGRETGTDFQATTIIANGATP